MVVHRYDVKVLAVSGDNLDIEVKSTSEPIVYCWPGLAIRALREGLDAQLGSFDLSTEAGLAHAAERWISRVDMLATRKGLAHYRVVAKDKTLFTGLKKGAKWQSNALGLGLFAYGKGVALSDNKLMAAIVQVKSPIPCHPIELVALTKKGPGANKGWLNHPDVVGIDAWGDRIVTWSPSLVRIWSDSGELLEEKSREVTSACIGAQGLIVGTREGVFVEDTLVALGPVSAVASDHSTEPSTVAVLLDSGEVVLLSEQRETKRWKLVRGVGIAVRGEQVAVQAEDGTVHRYQSGVEHQTYTISRHSGESVYFAIPATHGFLLSTAGNRRLSLVSDEGEATILQPEFDAYTIDAQGGHILGTSQGDTARVSIWREDGSWVGNTLVPKSNLHRNQSPNKKHPTRLSRDGGWLACADAEHKGGGVSLVGLRGQGQTRFANPRADYDFLTEIEELEDGSWLVGYGNHNALIWKLDGSTRDLGEKIDMAWVAKGGVLTSREKQVAVWDASMTTSSRFEVPVEYGMWWLESSSDRGYVLAGAKRAWLYEVSSGSPWELESKREVYWASFFGHHRYFVTAENAERGYVHRIWDATTRTVLVEEAELGYSYGGKWLADDSLLLVGSAKTLRISLKGKKTTVSERPRGSQIVDPQITVGFDERGQLYTHGARTHLQAWKTPSSGLTHGGYYGPSILGYTPGWCICLGEWPAVAMRMPGTK